MKNGILYTGLALSIFFLGIVLPVVVISGKFKPNYLVMLAFWLVVGIASWSELQHRKQR